MLKTSVKNNKNIHVKVGLSLIAFAYVVVISLSSCSKTSSPTQPVTTDSSVVTTKNAGISLAPVPAGSYMQGADRKIASQSTNPDWEFEIPQRKVTITRAMYVSQCEITESQWRSVMKDSTPYVNGPNFPKTMIKWYDAIRFCNSLSVMEGLTPAYEISGAEQKNGLNVSWNRNASGYRLLTNAEWEYVSKAGTVTDVYNGNVTVFDWYNKIALDTILDQIAWYYSNSGFALHQVALKKPSPWKLYDILGNAQEFCFDGFRNNLDSVPITDPIDYYPRDSSAKNLRGGSYLDYAFYVRSASSGYQLDAITPNKTVGFRVVRNK